LPNNEFIYSLRQPNILKSILFRAFLVSLFLQSLLSQAQNNCDINAINAAFTGAGYIAVPVNGQPCSMYFMNPTSQSATASETQAQALGAHMVVFNDATENANVVAGINAAGYGGATICVNRQRKVD
jgi:hypothetical protein